MRQQLVQISLNKLLAMGRRHAQRIEFVGSTESQIDQVVGVHVLLFVGAMEVGLAVSAGDGEIEADFVAPGLVVFLGRFVGKKSADEVSR